MDGIQKRMLRFLTGKCLGFVIRDTSGRHEYRIVRQKIMDARAAVDGQ